MASIVIAICLLFACSSSVAQNISIKFLDSTRAQIHIDSADWSDAWIEVNGQSPNANPLKKEDLVISDRDQRAEILSLDSIGAKYRSDLSITFVLDNSGSMFHTFDSLTRICDSVIDSLPAGVLFQALTFDNLERTPTHLATRRPSIYIAQSGFLDSIRAVKTFWHYYDSIRTGYTPLYDAIATAVNHIIDRRLHDRDQRNDVMIVVTDGDDNASRTSIEGLEQLCKHAQITFFSVNFRTEEDDRMEWFIRHVRGHYFYAEDISELKSGLKDIGRSMSRQYHIRYRFPDLGPSATHR